jgi:hypothetical protein
MPSPILRCENWDALLVELAKNAEWRFPDQVSRRIAAAVLAAPAAIALWIAKRLPRLADHDRLRVLVIGAETVDAVDEGRWYALMPHLLGRQCTVDATLLGDQLDAGFSSDAAHLAPGRPARRVRTTLGDFLRQENVAGYDIAVVFHPGMQKNHAWLEDGSLARIVASGVPLLASAYEEVECEMDQWVIESYGFAARGEALLNPFFLDLSDARTTIQWARTLWLFGPQVPAPGQVPDRDRLEALDLLTRMVMHSMLEGPAPAFEPGARIELQSSTGVRRSLIHVFDRYCVDPDTRKLVQLTPAGELREYGVLSPEEVSTYPASSTRDIDRALWAARIKAERILAPDTHHRLNDLAAAEAAGMFSGLRERARSLFRR